MTDQTPQTSPAVEPQSPALRDVTIQIPTAVAQKMTEGFDGTLEDATLAGLKLLHGMGMPHYNLLQSLAKQLGTSPHKALRIAIDELQKQADHNTPAPPQLGRPVINTERDNAIYLRLTEGATQAEVAHAFNISVVRVGQIMAQQRAMRGIKARQKANPATATQPAKQTPVWPGHAGAPHEQPAYKARTQLGDMFFEMDAGATAEQAAEKYGITPDQARAGYVAYKAECAPGASRGEKALAAFAGLHAIDNYGKEPEDKPLTLKDSEEGAEPKKPRFVMPSLEAIKAARAAHELDPRTPIERDTFDPEFGF